MYRSISLSILALTLVSAAQPVAAQDARACVNETGRLKESFPLAGTGDRDGAGSTTADVPSPSAQQEAREVEQSGGVVTSSPPGETAMATDRPSGNAEPGRIAQEPGVRAGASLGDEQRRRIQDLIQQAQSAGERGDGAGCLQRLGEARGLLRQAGVGSTQPGSPAGFGGTTGTTTGGTGGTTTGTTGTGGDAGAAGAMEGGVGGGAAGGGATGSSGSGSGSGSGGR
ncbi:MAG TPA: hypothetical protein VEB64_17480 [Azospirillaceae bacterium]|nr:hypothetical protein [Azospirillaceae bacterium]